MGQPAAVLNNAAEVTFIIGTIGDEVNWTTNEPGFSLSRITGSDAMFISAYPTINSTNMDMMQNLPTMTTDLFITEYLHQLTQLAISQMVNGLKFSTMVV